MAEQIETIAHIRARLSLTGDACCPALLGCFADQVRLTGTDTTPDDACSAWHRWLMAAGGRSERPLQASDWKDGHMVRFAAAIREVARYT